MGNQRVRNSRLVFAGSLPAMSPGCHSHVFRTSHLR